MPRVVASEEFSRRYLETFGAGFDGAGIEKHALHAGLGYEVPARLQGCASVAQLYAAAADEGPTYLRILKADAWPDLPYLYDRLRMSAGVTKRLEEADTERIEASEQGYLVCALGLALASSYDVAVVAPERQIGLYASHSEVMAALPARSAWSKAFGRACDSMHLPRAIAVGDRAL
jgi:hypothetical protein